MTLFKGKTVSSIVAAFEKTIQELEALAEQKLDEVADHELTIAKARLAKTEAQTEADKAQAISAKISQLITE